ncbi:MAG: molybdopterin cofactor-binding domain-containing protein [Pseudomonadota bacterium]
MIKATAFTLNRRQFVIGSTLSSFSVGMSLSLDAEAAMSTTKHAPEINAWVVINPDESIIVRIARSEMGQGTLTGLAQMVAEELECDWNNVDWEYPTPGQSLARDRAWGSFGTGGSSGIRGSHQYVREGGAIAREMLIAAAAQLWKVPAQECRVSKGVITHAKSGKKTTYGQVAALATKMSPPQKVTLKDPKDWQVIGQPMKRLDTAEKVNGQQIYGADLQLPGMLNATIKACPVFGGKLKSFDDSATKKSPGVKAVVAVEDNAVAVIADTWWHAKKGMDQLKIEWDKGKHQKESSQTIEKFIDEGLTAKEAFVGNQNGDVNKAFEGAHKTIEATYRYPFQNHATMEPMNATAKWTPEKCEVWCPTQNGEAAFAAAADAAELPQEKCEVYKISLGGGFGRRGAFHDYVRQAVLVAKQMPGTPIKLLWSREEDMQHGFYHPLTKAKVKGALDKAGNLTALNMRISGQSILAAVRPGSVTNGDQLVFQGLLPQGSHAISYSIPNLLVDHAMRNPHVPPGFWRGVNVNQNAIYMECFLDELAHAANKDPLVFRRELMQKHPKSLAVLEAVAEKSGWKNNGKDNIYRGLAVCYSFGSYTAACAEVKLTGDGGAIKMHRIVAATDPGYAVNPQQIKAQVEGSFVYGLSAMLYGECTVKDGAIEQTNFHNYSSLRLAQMPKVETIVMPSGGFWGGVGEPTIAVAAPAVLNAIFAATGKRLRQIPLKDADIQWA